MGIKAHQKSKTAKATIERLMKEQDELEKEIELEKATEEVARSQVSNPASLLVLTVTWSLDPI